MTVDGLEFIPEQGIAQFELLTGRIAPKGVMKREIAERLAREDDAGVDGGRMTGVIGQSEDIVRIARAEWGGVDAI